MDKNVRQEEIERLLSLWDHINRSKKLRNEWVLTTIERYIARLQEIERKHQEDINNNKRI